MKGKIREKERFHPLVLSPNIHKGQNWACPKSGVPTDLPPWGRHLGHPPVHILGHRQGAGVEVAQPGVEPVPMWDVGKTESSFTAAAQQC